MTIEGGAHYFPLALAGLDPAGIAGRGALRALDAVIARTPSEAWGTNQSRRS